MKKPLRVLHKKDWILAEAMCKQKEPWAPDQYRNK